MTITTAIELILGAIVIVILFSVGSMLFKACQQQPTSLVFEDQERFATAIETIAELDYDDSMYIPFVSDFESIGDNEDYYEFLIYAKQDTGKPDNCKGQACICAVRFQQTQPIKCIVLGEIEECTRRASSDVPCIYSHDGMFKKIQPMFHEGVKITKRNNVLLFET
jgi:hypothetical protein